MSVNRTIFNLCAGMIEDGETIEECIRRDFMKKLVPPIKQIRTILPPSYAAVGISDTKTYIAIVDAEGEFSDHTSDNEMIQAQFYTKEEVGPNYWETEEFSSRSQIIAYFFVQGFDRYLTFIFSYAIIH